MQYDSLGICTVFYVCTWCSLISDNNQPFRFMAVLTAKCVTLTKLGTGKHGMLSCLNFAKFCSWRQVSQTEVDGDRCLKQVDGGRCLKQKLMETGVSNRGWWRQVSQTEVDGDRCLKQRLMETGVSNRGWWRRVSNRGWWRHVSQTEVDGDKCLKQRLRSDWNLYLVSCSSCLYEKQFFNKIWIKWKKNCTHCTGS